MNTPTKTIARGASTFQPLVEPMGSCIASDRITVDGLPVGYMYREQPDITLLPQAVVKAQPERPELPSPMPPQISGESRPC